MRVPPVTQPTVIRPLAPERYKLQVTISGETCAKLRRAQDLLRHTSGRGDEADVIDRALTLLVAQLEKAKFGTADRPRADAAGDPTSRRRRPDLTPYPRMPEARRQPARRISLRVRRRTWAVRSDRGPGVPPPELLAENLELRCRAHNAYEAEQWFGPMFVRETAARWRELGLDQVHGE